METATPASQTYIRKVPAPSIGEIFMSTGFPGGSEGKASACNARDLCSIHGLGRSSGEGNGNPLQDSCLENSTEEPGRLQSMGSQSVTHDWSTSLYVHTRVSTCICEYMCTCTWVFENQLLISLFTAHKVSFEKSIKKGRRETYFPLQEKSIKCQIWTVPGSKFF